MYSTNRNYFFLLFCLVISITFWHCEKDHGEGDELVIQTQPVTIISSKGATFEVIFSIKGKVNITEYGFIWNKYKIDWIENANRISFQGKPTLNRISYNIDRNLDIGKTYVICAYAIVDQKTVLGNYALFKSLGSKGPEINSFFPETANWTDTITILGRYFGDSLSLLEVNLGEKTAPIISLNDTVVRIIVPMEKLERNSPIQVSVGGNSTIAQQPLHILFPVVSGFFPSVIRPGDTLTILGSGFDPKGRFTRVFFNDFQSAILTGDSNYIKIKVPYQITNKRRDITINSAWHVIKTSDEVEIPIPIINSIDPDTIIKPGSLITLVGENFNPMASYNSLKMDAFPLTVISATYNDIVAVVPMNIVTDKTITEIRDIHLTLEVAGVSVVAKPKLEWQGYFTRKKDFPGPNIISGVSFAIENDLFFGLGFTSDNIKGKKYSMSFWNFDSETNDWNEINPFPGLPRELGVAYSINNKGYVGLGFHYNNNGFVYLDDFYLYDPLTNSWFYSSKYPSGGTRGAFSFVLNEQAWVGMGVYYDQPRNEFIFRQNINTYSFETNNWQEQRFAPITSWLTMGATTSNAAYIYKSKTLLKLQNDAFVYHTAAKDVLDASAFFFALKNNLYFGFNNPVHGGTPNRIIYEVDPDTGNVTREFLFPIVSHSYFHVSVINDIAIFMDLVTKQTWQFNPFVQFP